MEKVFIENEEEEFEYDKVKEIHMQSFYQFIAVGSQGSQFHFKLGAHCIQISHLLPNSKKKKKTIMD